MNQYNFNGKEHNKMDKSLSLKPKDKESYKKKLCEASSALFYAFPRVNEPNQSLMLLLLFLFKYQRNKTQIYLLTD